MNTLQPIIKEEGSFQDYDNFHNGNRTLTPVYFEKDGKQNFVCNLVTKHEKRQYEVENSRREIEDYFRQLNTNDGRYFAFYSIDKDVFSFLDWVKDKGYHFEHFAGFYIAPDFDEFHGNLKEYSAAFNYRIYDKELTQELMKRLPNLEIKDFTKTI